MRVYHAEQADGRTATDRRCVLAERVEAAVARILADAERGVAERRAHRTDWMNTHAGIIRDARRKKTL